MSTLINEVDARTRLAGANQMELLLFHVGTGEVFGINVFKVREVMKEPSLTRVPEADERISGLANIRGTMVPVIALRRALALGGGCSREGDGADAGHLIITEYNGTLQAFQVCGVAHIIRTSWSDIKTPPALVRENNKGVVTAVTLLEDGRMVLILDVEKILSDICPRSDEEVYSAVQTQVALKAKCVLFADDSSVARTQIRKTLERIGIGFIQTTTGKEAWDALLAIADEADKSGIPVAARVQLVLSDIEMPDMDGFTLTRHIRSDPRFIHMPVILHSSLTGSCNMEKGRAVGATDYVTKFDPNALGSKLMRYLQATDVKGRDA